MSVNYLGSHEGLLKEFGGVEQSDLCVKEITLGDDSWGRDRRGSCARLRGKLSADELRQWEGDGGWVVMKASYRR